MRRTENQIMPLTIHKRVYSTNYREWQQQLFGFSHYMLKSHRVFCESTTNEKEQGHKIRVYQMTPHIICTLVPRKPIYMLHNHREYGQSLEVINIENS